MQNVTATNLHVRLAVTKLSVRCKQLLCPLALRLVDITLPDAQGKILLDLDDSERVGEASSG